MKRNNTVISKFIRLVLVLAFIFVTPSAIIATEVIQTSGNITLTPTVEDKTVTVDYTITVTTPNTALTIYELSVSTDGSASITSEQGLVSGSGSSITIIVDNVGSGSASASHSGTFVVTYNNYSDEYNISASVEATTSEMSTLDWGEMRTSNSRSISLPAPTTAPPTPTPTPTPVPTTTTTTAAPTTAQPTAAPTQAPTPVPTTARPTSTTQAPTQPTTEIPAPTISYTPMDARYAATADIVAKSGPDLSSDTIFAVNEGTEVDIIGMAAGGWYITEYQGAMAFLPGAYLQEVTENVPAPGTTTAEVEETTALAEESSETSDPSESSETTETSESTESTTTAEETTEAVVPGNVDETQSGLTVPPNTASAASSAVGGSFFANFQDTLTNPMVLAVIGGVLLLILILIIVLSNRDRKEEAAEEVAEDEAYVAPQVIGANETPAEVAGEEQVTDPSEYARVPEAKAVDPAGNPADAPRAPHIEAPEEKSVRRFQPPNVD